MAEKKRVTQHNGRSGANGSYSPKHNDRNFNLKNAPHIEEEMTDYNWYSHYYENDPEVMKLNPTFEDVEALFYEEHFREALDARNQKSIDQRHSERVKSMNDYRKSQKTCPEEQIIQIGKKDNTVDPNILKQIFLEQIEWEKEHYPNVVILDVALHVDETTPHIHKRQVWIAHDEEGREIVGQAKALAEMGIQAPDPEKKYGKYNNAKVTYTKECRDHLIEICGRYELELELVPEEKSRAGLALDEYKALQEQKKAIQAEQAAEFARENMAFLDVQTAQKRAEKKKIEDDLAEAEKELNEANTELEKYQNLGLALKQREAQYEAVNEELKRILELKAEAAKINKPFKKNDGTMTVYKEMYDDIVRIGTEVSKVNKSVKENKKDIASLETKLTEQRQAINPWIKKLNEREKLLDEREKNLDYTIWQNSEKKAQAKFNDFLETYYGNRLPLDERDDRLDRLEKMCDKVTLKNGSTVLQVFEEREQALTQEIRNSYNMWMEDHNLR